MSDKFMIIDGNSILFRAFYAMPPLKTKNGQYTNAVYGFLNMLYKLIDDYSPQYICVAFDPQKPTFRHQQYKEYKAGRAKAPDELVQQFGLIREVLKQHNISCVEIDGFEADDVAGTFAENLKEKDIVTYLVTSDKDYLQLVDNNVKVLLTKKGVTNIKEMNREQVNEDYEIEPEEFVDLKALMGDKSDNIPGVMGVGEKTAIKLIKLYHNLDSLYEHIEEVKGKLKDKLQNDKMQAYMSKELAKIVTDIPIDIDIDDYKLNEFDNSKLYDLYTELEFKNFKRKIEKLVKDNKKSSEDNNDTQISIFNVSNMSKTGKTLTDRPETYEKKEIVIEKNTMIYVDKNNIDILDEIIKNIKDSNKLAFKFIIDGDRTLFSDAVALVLSCCNKKVYYIDLVELDENSVSQNFKEIFESKNIDKIGHELKSDIIYLMKHDISLNNVKFDLAIGTYIIDPSINSYSIDKLSSRYLDLDIVPLKDYLGTGKSKKELSELDLEQRRDYGFDYINTIVNCKDIIMEEISGLNMTKLFDEIEMPLVKVLASMEYEGFRIDLDKINELGEIFNNKLIILENVIHEMAGEDFNINSPKQLGVILFEKLNLEVIKKTKTGYSTNVEVLEKLKDKHPIIVKIMEYRQLSKLNSTYVEGLKNQIKGDNRVYSVLNQTITTTGRISSTEPNLQNIPTRTEEGKEIRKAFIAKDGYVLVDADYSQIELRVLAQLSNEEKLIEAFKHHDDIHTKTASEVFKVDIKDVTSTMRSRAKAVNFGIIYGISDFGLSRDLSIPRKEAKEYISNYLSYYNNIETYMKDIVEKSKIDLFVETYFGRRRNVPELQSRNQRIRSFGERIALNTPVQGTAADIIKIAMINVYNKLKEKNLKSKLLLQVHDELIIETSLDEVDEVKELLKYEMEHAVEDFKVKLDVDINIGDSWYDAK